MKIDVKNIVAQKSEFIFTAPNSAFSLDEVVQEVQVKVKLEKIQNEILVRGNIKTQLELECSRCLEHFLFPVNENFQTIFQPFSPASTEEEEEIELAKDELDIEFYKNDVIDLQEIVREQIILSIPIMPICDKNCQGLCPKCGQNLNQNKCLCTTEAIDPRWAKLEQLAKSNIIIK
jgi:uncharacterized protein